MIVRDLVVECGDNSTLGIVRDGVISIYECIGFAPVLEGVDANGADILPRSVYFTLHGIWEPRAECDIDRQVRLYR